MFSTIYIFTFYSKRIKLLLFSFGKCFIKYLTITTICTVTAVSAWWVNYITIHDISWQFKAVCNMSSRFLTISGNSWQFLMIHNDSQWFMTFLTNYDNSCRFMNKHYDFFTQDKLLQFLVIYTIHGDSCITMTIYDESWKFIMHHYNIF